MLPFRSPISPLPRPSSASGASPATPESGGQIPRRVTSLGLSSGPGWASGSRSGVPLIEIRSPVLSPESSPPISRAGTPTPGVAPGIEHVLVSAGRVGLDGGHEDGAPDALGPVSVSDTEEVDAQTGAEISDVHPSIAVDSAPSPSPPSPSLPVQVAPVVDASPSPSTPSEPAGEPFEVEYPGITAPVILAPERETISPSLPTTVLAPVTEKTAPSPPSLPSPSFLSPPSLSPPSSLLPPSSLPALPPSPSPPSLPSPSSLPALPPSPSPSAGSASPAPASSLAPTASPSPSSPERSLTQSRPTPPAASTTLSPSPPPVPTPTASAAPAPTPTYAQVAAATPTTSIAPVHTSTSPKAPAHSPTAPAAPAPTTTASSAPAPATTSSAAPSATATAAPSVSPSSSPATSASISSENQFPTMFKADTNMDTALSDVNHSDGDDGKAVAVTGSSPRHGDKDTSRMDDISAESAPGTREDDTTKSHIETNSNTESSSSDDKEKSHNHNDDTATRTADSPTKLPDITTTTPSLDPFNSLKLFTTSPTTVTQPLAQVPARRRADPPMSPLDPISPWPPRDVPDDEAEAADGNGNGDAASRRQHLTTSHAQSTTDLPSAKEVYGSLAVLLTYLAFGTYLVWAAAPHGFLDRMGWTWYPSREWAVVVPCWLMLIVLLTYFSYAALTLFLTPSLQSRTIMVDDYSATPPSTEPYHWRFADPTAVPHAVDLPLEVVNAVLYPRRPVKGVENKGGSKSEAK